MRHTPYHAYEVPEHGDENYDAVIQTLVNAIDSDVLIRRPRGARPSPGERGRWFLATDTNPPTLSYDTGDSWVGIGGDYDLPPEVTYSDVPETITAQWSADVALDADISGSAATADEAEHAQEADDAKRLDGSPPDEFVHADQEETIQRRWRFLEQVELSGQIEVVDGVINLPQHTGSDPPSSERQEGSMWYRIDDQPT